MLRLSQKQCAALEAVVHIACQKGGDPVSGKMLAKAINQPPRYLEPMLQQLVHTRILRGVRGPHGGYVLAMERRRINVRTICEALTKEDNLRPTRISALGEALVAPLCDKALTAAHKALEDIPLTHLCEQAQQAKQRNIVRGNKPDFTI